MLVEGSGHELQGAIKKPEAVVERFLSFLASGSSSAAGFRG
jgi:hypothetical protein